MALIVMADKMLADTSRSSKRIEDVLRTSKFSAAALRRAADNNFQILHSGMTNGIYSSLMAARGKISFSFC